MSEPIGTTLPCSDPRIYNKEFTLLSDSQDIAGALQGAGKTDEGYTALLVKTGDAELLEVWATVFRNPWSLKALYERIA